MEFALLHRLTAKPGQRQRVVEIPLESGKLFDDNTACRLHLVAESADDPPSDLGGGSVDERRRAPQIRVLPAGGKVPG